MAQRWNLVLGIDCGGGFRPACRLQRIHMVLTIVAGQKWEALQLDVQAALLNTVIEGDVYVAEAPSFETTGGSLQAMKLLKKACTAC